MANDAVNPYLRSAAFNIWTMDNSFKSVSYHMRLFAVRKNAATIHIRQEHIGVLPESLLLLRPGVPYDFSNAEQDMRFHLYSCNFDLTREHRDTAPFLPPAHEPQFLSARIVGAADAIPLFGEYLLLQDCPSLCQQIQRIYELSIANDPYADEIASGIIKEVLFEALRLQRMQNTSAGGAVHGAELARKTMQYIREHCTEQINERSVAEHMNYHPYYLSRLTQQHYGVTPYRYLIKCRMELAVRMLCGTDLPIGDVGTACGFPSQTHFCAFIRRETGMSPSALRKNGPNGGSWSF